MVDVRSLPGIRYAAEADLATLVTPPYDVISPDAQTRYYARHPHNIIRLELGRDEPSDDDLDNKYTRAAATFAEWRLQDVMRQDAPSLYLYEQRFAVAGAAFARRSLLARVRLEPWEAEVVLPHERTMSKPKADRLQLMRACAANLSPIMSLYDDPDDGLAATLAVAASAAPIADFADEAGERHLLWPIRDGGIAAAVAAFFRDRQIYIADGHHRYETALAYRDEVAAVRKEPLPEGDPVNFTLMALCAIEDPNLVVLPTHRQLRDLDAERLAELDSALGAYFDVRPVENGDGEGAAGALAAIQEASAQGETAFGLVRPEGIALLRLRPEGRAAMEQLAGEHANASPAWRALDVAILHELALSRGLGVGEEAVRAGEHVTYTRDAEAAIAAVRAGEAELAFLLAPTPPAAIRDVARAGDRMPQKSTYFYPKLITGLVVNPLW
jgi:uncharacterized protein (DUF1015 family)